MQKKKSNKAQIGTILKPITHENVIDFLSLLSIPQKAITKLITGKYQAPSEAMGIKNKAGAIATDILLDPINLVGAGVVGKAAGKAVKASKESGKLSKAYKLNPWAFKPNPEAYYHRSPNIDNIINKEKGILQGFGESEAGRKFTEDVYNTKLSFGEVPILNLRKGANSRLYFSKGTPLDWGRTNMRLDEETGKMISGQGYKGPYIVEVKDVPMGSSTKGRAPGAEPTKIGSYAVSKRPINIDEAKFYKEDWLKGYKEVKPPKKEEGGWLDKYDNAPKAQNGIEGTMGGLTDVGFNYNGAWGGTMQLGGSLPGATGNMYARIGAPSNGKHAKKTKASAQDGKSIKNREDFSSWFPWLSNIASGGSGRKEKPEYGKLTDLYRYYAGEPLKYNVLEKSQYKPSSSKDSNANYISINDPNFLQEVVDSYNKASEGNLKSSTHGKEFKYSNKDIYNVSGYKNRKEAWAMGHYNVSKGKDNQGEYISYYDKFDATPGKDENLWEKIGIVKPFEIYGRVYIDPKTGKPKMQNGGEIKYMDLPEITVVGSKDKGTRDFYNNLIGTLMQQEDDKGRNISNPYIDSTIMGNYLGIMNLGKEYGFPKVKPETKSGLLYKNANGHYNPISKTIYANNLDTWVHEFAHHVQMKDNIVGKGLQWLGNDLVQYIKKPAIELRNAFKYGANSSPLDYSQEDFNEWSSASPYQKEGTVEHEAHSIIQPMLYEKIKNSIDAYKNSDVSKARKDRWFYERNKQNGGEIKYYQEGLDFKPKTISEDGSIITPYGQWEYPGEITTIPSNEITMQDVPYPVLGISDTGDTQMMYPGEDYEFDGESVTEYPMAQNGKKIKIPFSDFKKLRQKYYDSAYTNQYTRSVLDAAENNPKELDETISRYSELLENDSDIKPTSYSYKNINGKKYKIPVYAEPKTDPFEIYDPQEGWWEKVQSGLNKTRDVVNSNSIGKQIGKVSDKIDETLQNIWHKFTSGDESDNVINKGAEVFTNKQPVSKPTPKPAAKKETPDRFGLTREDYINARKSKFISTPGNDKGDGYYELKKDGKSYKVYTSSGGNSWVDVPTKPKPKPKPVQQKVEPKKSQSQQPINKQEQPKPVERKQNVYEGTPAYSGSVGSGMPSSLIGFVNQKGDTTYIKPEDYERFAVPKYGKEFIESKKKQRNGGVNSADAQPLKKLDQLLNFTNYNKSSKGGWLDKYN